MVMREFVFTLRYEAESDPLMDVFIDHPNHRYVTRLLGHDRKYVATRPC